MILQNWYGLVALIVWFVVWVPWAQQCREEPMLRNSWYWFVNPFAGPVALFCNLIVGIAGSKWNFIIWFLPMTALGIWNYKTWLKYKDDKNPRGGKKLRALIPIKIKG